MFISRQEFLEIKKLNGLYVFVFDGGCPLCKIHVTSLYKNGLSGFTIILLEDDEDLEWLKEVFNADGVPHTSVYKNNKLIWHLNNIFFNKQIKELNKYMKI